MVLPLFQMFVSRLTAYFRRKCVATTDERVQKMNEVLNYIKFIKMYAWVKPFSQNVQSEFPQSVNVSFSADALLLCSLVHPDFVL